MIKEIVDSIHVVTRYDWSKIPAGYNWAATDDDGEVWVYSNKPVIHQRYEQWTNDGGIFDLFTNGKPCPNWRESLEQRP